MPAVLKDLASGDVFELGDFSLIGRNDGVTIRLQDSSISRQHATIRREDRDFWIVDLGSANGSYVNNVALTAARVLRHGDRVQLGTAVLIFQQQDAVDAGAFSPDAKTTVSIVSPQPQKNVEATLFVADLRGFTRLSALLTNGEVADLLREWYADCNAILKRHGASIDKFIGDCVFAYWHGKDPDIRIRAVQAARALRDAEHEPISPTRLLLRERHNLSLDCGIGLHVGPVAIGAMGKGINTAVGDAVNIAFRIETLTRVVGRSTLVSTAFLEGWDEGRRHFDSCGFHFVKGPAEAIEVFAPRAIP
jgi:adenylate cyclase